MTQPDPEDAGHLDPDRADDAADSSGQVSEVARLDEDESDTPISDGDAAAGYPTSESGEAQEPAPEAGPNANPNRDDDTH